MRIRYDRQHPFVKVVFKHYSGTTGSDSRRRDCHLITPPCTVIRRSNRDEQGGVLKMTQSRRRPGSDMDSMTLNQWTLFCEECHIMSGGMSRAALDRIFLRANMDRSVVGLGTLSSLARFATTFSDFLLRICIEFYATLKEKRSRQVGQLPAGQPPGAQRPQGDEGRQGRQQDDAGVSWDAGAACCCELLGVSKV